MTGMQFADSLRDARTLSGGAPAYAWVCDWRTPVGVPLGIAAQEAARLSGQNGQLSLWLCGCVSVFRGRYTADAPVFALAMDEAAQHLRETGAILFPTAVRHARGATTFRAWSASALEGGLRAAYAAGTDERVFLPWLHAMCARYQQE